MKKIKLLLSLFMAFVGFTASYAETITTTPVENGESITSGYYIMRCAFTAYDNQAVAKIKEKDGINYLAWDKPTAINENYVWKINSSSNGKFTLMHIASQTYAGTPKSGDGMSASGGNVFPMVSETNAIEFSIAFIENSKNQYNLIPTGAYAMHADALQWDYNECYMVTYPGGANSASAWRFEKITDEEGDALNDKYGKNTSAITIKCVDEKDNLISTQEGTSIIGSSYSLSAPSINYYTYSATTVDATATTDESFEVSKKTHEIIYKYIYNPPFTPATNDINGSFPTDTKWYLLKVRDGYYITYDANNPDYIVITNNPGIDDKYWWTFTGSLEAGYKIYNKAAGATKIMRSNSPKDDENNGGNTFPAMVEKTDDNTALNSEWTIYGSNKISGKNGFFLSRKDETIKLNQFGGATATKLAFYTGNPDEGSTFTATSVEEVISSYAEYAPEGILAVGTIKESLRADFEKLLNNKTLEGLKAVTEMITDDNLIQLSDWGYYKILNQARQSKNFYLTVTNEQKLWGNEASATNAAQIWKVTPTETTGTYMFSAQNNYFKNSAFTKNVETTEDINTAQDYKLITRTGFPGYYAIKPNSDNQELHLAGGLDVVGYNGSNAGKNEPSSWMLIPAKSIDITIGTAGYATMNFQFPVTLPKTLKAYQGEASGNKFVLSEINGTIPANSPVILEGEPGTYTLTIENNEAEALETGLQGTCLPKAIDGNVTAYVLAKPEAKEVGFYKLNDTDRTIGANKAYLTVTAPAGIKAFTFDFGGTTGIENTEAVTETEEYYDLQGRRVMNPTKGIYVTKSGKKVLFTK